MLDRLFALNWLTLDRFIVTFTAVMAAASLVVACLVLRRERARDRRRPIVVETSLEPAAGRPGWHKARLEIRNPEAVAVRVLGLVTTASEARLLMPEQAAVDDGAESALLGRALPIEKAAKRLDWRFTVRPIGTGLSAAYADDSAVCDFLVYGPCRENQIHVEWIWADGHKG